MKRMLIVVGILAATIMCVTCLTASVSATDSHVDFINHEVADSNFPVTIRVGYDSYADYYEDSGLIKLVGQDATYNSFDWLAIGIDPKNIRTVIIETGNDLGHELKYLGAIFKNCVNLKSVYVTYSEFGPCWIDPTNLTIGDYAFYGCTSLESVTFSNNTVKIANYAFEGCTSLKSINFGAVSEICEYAFEGCTSLKSIHFKGTQIGNYAFNGTPLENVDIQSDTAIGEYAFASCTSLKEMSFDHVISIGNHAFAGSGLTTLTISAPTTAVSVGAFENCSYLEYVKIQGANVCDNAFLNCTSLKKLEFDGYVIGSSAFKNCTSLESVIIGEHTTVVGDHAFSDCYSLKIVDMLSKNCPIGAYAFFNCSRLESIDLSSSGTIYEHAFENCTHLKSVKINSENCRNIGAYAFHNCAALESVELYGPVVIGEQAFAVCSLKSVIIGDSVKEIGDYAFRECLWLKSVEMKGEVAIGENVFEKCYGVDTLKIDGSVKTIHRGMVANFYWLKHVIIGDSVVSIDAHAFEKNVSLESVEFKGRIAIGDHAFDSCRNLQNINIENAISIGDGAFKGCTSLKSVKISAESVGQNAFENCTSLESVVFGDSVKVIDCNAFLNCTSLKTIEINGVTEIKEDAFENCTSLESAIVGGSVKVIDGQTLANIPSLKHVIVKKSVESIGANAFDSRTSLESVEFEGKVSIEDAAFYSCSNLNSINLENATSIGEYAFAHCTSLKSVNVYCSIGKSAFEDCKNLNSAYVKATTIGEYAFRGCVKLQSATIHVETVGQGAFESSGLRAVMFGECVKEIRDMAFANCEYLESVTFYCNVTVYGYAFANCHSLKSVEVQKDVVFKKDAFIYCPNLESEIIGTTVTNVNKDMIVVCPSLKHVIIGYLVTSIDAHAFEECTSLESVDISRNVVIGDYAFHSCTNLKSIDFDKISYIGEGAFKDCKGLESISINGCENIGAHAFENCIGLKHVIIGESVKSINDSAFRNCTSLSSLDFPSIGNIVIGENAFGNCSLTVIDFMHSVKSAEKGAFVNTNNPDLLKRIVIGNNWKSGADFKAIFGHDAFIEGGKISKDYSNSVFVLEGNKFIQHQKPKLTVDNNVAVIFNGSSYTCTSSYMEGGSVVKVLANHMDGYKATILINGKEVEEGEYTISGDAKISVRYTALQNGEFIRNDDNIIAFADGIIVKCGDRILQNGETVEYGTELTVYLAENSGYTGIRVGQCTVDGKWTVEGNTIFTAVAEDSGIDPEFTTAVEMIAFILVVTAGVLILARYR